MQPEASTQKEQPSWGSGVMEAWTPVSQKGSEATRQNLGCRREVSFLFIDPNLDRDLVFPSVTNVCSHATDSGQGDSSARVLATKPGHLKSSRDPRDRGED